MTTPRKTAGKLVITKTAPKNRPASLSPARKAAFHILLAVERGHSHSDDLLRGKAVSALSAPDRNLTTALVLGVLRWQIRLDHQLLPLLTRPNARLEPEILIALRLGAFQVLHLDRIPARAAIDESVELAKQSGHRFASAMVNAVLRKLAKMRQVAGKLEIDPALYQGTTSVVPQVQQIEAEALQAAEKLVSMKGTGFSPYISAKNPTGALAPEGSFSADCEAHPTWMVARWVNLYGPEAAHAICRHGQSQPSVTLRLASPAIEDELAQTGVTFEDGQLLTAARTLLSGDVTATAAFREGRVRLQDEGSQLVAELSGFSADSLNNPNQNQNRILDACAAPGGKTLILAERNPASHIVALESSATRLDQLRKRLAPLGDRIECRLADATTLTEDSTYDLALADVPCSGTGTLGRNPEIRHRLRPEDLIRQAERQRAILAATLRALRPGGRVVYSTCSLEPEENEQVVAAVLAATPNARQLSFESRLNDLLHEGILTENAAEHLNANLTAEGALRLLPGTFHTDGFFIALLERIE